MQTTQEEWTGRGCCNLCAGVTLFAAAGVARASFCCRAMPLRLLERVLPWLFSELSDEDAEGMMTNLRLGAPAVDQQLVELLLRWAQRGRWPVLPDVVAVAGAAAAAAAAAATGGSGEAAAEQRRVQQEQEQDPQQQQGQPVEGSDNPAVVGEAVSAAVIEDLCTSCDASVTLNAAAGAAAEQQQAGETQSAQQQPQPQPQQQGFPAGGGVDMGPDAMARRRHDFLLEMQHRFLDGLDGEHQDYAAIDGDVGLDEDWARQQAQDAEDAYFDAD